MQTVNGVAWWKMMLVLNEGWSAANKGCPYQDKDGDGGYWIRMIKCQNVAGTVAKPRLPELLIKFRKQLTEYARTNRYLILVNLQSIAESTYVMVDIITILKEYPNC